MSIWWYKQVHAHTKQFEKICITMGFEPMISCILRSCANHCTTSVDVTNLLYVVYCHVVGILSLWRVTWRLGTVSDVPAGAGPLRAPPCPQRRP